MELDAKHLELGGGDARFEVGFVELAEADLTLRVEVSGEQVESEADGEVEEEVLEEGFDDEVVERSWMKIFDVKSRKVEKSVEPAASALQNGLRAQKDDGGDEVPADSWKPVCVGLSKWVVAREIEDGRREKRPGIAEQGGPDDVVKERKDDVVCAVCDKNLRAHEDAKGGPAGEGDNEGSEPRVVRRIFHTELPRKL